MAIKTKTYAKAEFLNAMETLHGSPLKFFSLRYPCDPRCRFSLRVHYEFEDGSRDFSWYEAEDPQTVGHLLGLNVIEAQWDRFSDDRYLSVSYRD